MHHEQPGHNQFTWAWLGSNCRTNRSASIWRISKGRFEMKSLIKMPSVKTLAATVSLIGAGLMMSAPANAQVHVGIGLPGVHVGVGVGGPAPAYYYGPGYYPPGPCDAYNYYYGGDCGYSVYTGPVFIDGIAVNGPHYY